MGFVLEKKRGFSKLLPVLADEAKSRPQVPRRIKRRLSNAAKLARVKDQVGDKVRELVGDEIGKTIRVAGGRRFVRRYLLPVPVVGINLHGAQAAAAEPIPSANVEHAATPVRLSPAEVRGLRKARNRMRARGLSTRTINELAHADSVQFGDPMVTVADCDIDPLCDQFAGGLLDDLKEKVKNAIRDFQKAIRLFPDAVSSLTNSTGQLEAASAAAVQMPPGTAKQVMLARLSELTKENAGLQVKLADIRAKVDQGKQLVTELLAWLAKTGVGLGLFGSAQGVEEEEEFGIVPVVAIAAVGAIVLGVSQIVNAIFVHKEEVELERSKLEAVLAGTLGEGALTGPGGRGGPLGDLTKQAGGLVLAVGAIVALPTIMGAIKGR